MISRPATARCWPRATAACGRSSAAAPRSCRAPARPPGRGDEPGPAACRSAPTTSLRTPSSSIAARLFWSAPNGCVRRPRSVGTTPPARRHRPALDLQDGLGTLARTDNKVLGLTRFLRGQAGKQAAELGRIEARHGGFHGAWEASAYLTDRSEQGANQHALLTPPVPLFVTEATLPSISGDGRRA